MARSLSESDLIAGCLLFVTSTVGVLANSIVVFWISRLPSMKNAFGRLISSQAIADLLFCLGFCLFFAPMLIFNLQAWKSLQVSAWFGHLQLIAYDACNATHLTVSVNRALAIFRPIFYSTHFTTEKARLLNYVSWSVSFFPSIVAYYIADCRLYYSEEGWAYVFIVNSQCNFIAWYYDFIKSVACVGLIAGLDFVTFLKCRLRDSKMIHAISDARAKSRRKDDIRFVTQATLQGLIFLLELLTYFVFSSYMPTKMGRFVLTTIAWVAVHALDGIITILFNKELRNLMRKRSPIASVSQFSMKNSDEHGSQDPRSDHI